MIRDFFQHRARFRLEFSEEVSDHEDVLSLTFVSKTDTDILVSNDTTSKCNASSIPVKILCPDTTTILAVRSWLFRSILAFELKHPNGTAPL